jgi:hypothetical protein
VAVEASGTGFERRRRGHAARPSARRRLAEPPGAFLTVRAGVAHHLIQKRRLRVLELDRISA